MRKVVLLLSSVALGTSLLVLGPAANTSAGFASQDASAAIQSVSPAVAPSGEAAALPAAPATHGIAVPGNPPAGPLSQDLKAAVAGYVGELSRQPGFEKWAHADWTSQPLGPGTHGWVVLLRSGEQEIGYLIVHADEKGSYRLTEYGKGSFPLFSQNTLYRSLVRLELIEYTYRAEPYYWNPLQAVWKVTVDNADRIWYIDAKTGEELPFMTAGGFPEPSSSLQTFTKTEAQHTIVQAGHTTPADPYARLSWVKGTPSAADPSFALLQSQIKAGTPPVFAAELYSGKVITPLGVSGYHEWSGSDRYVQVIQDDDRYLPLDALTHLGHFYP
ncbi:hypothetical protein WMW72_21595 [Paenibacillus filicis]|uniref:Uncharacterized protein n=1 Tax=Paenibacillus filicis TaxID=669464 RepID=A0ABU9DNP5_9BACL